MYLYTEWLTGMITNMEYILCILLIRNRAITGDIVCVQLLDRSEWKGVTTKLPSRDTNDESHDESCDNPRPTGRVVGIWSRSNRDIIASFPVKLMGCFILK